MRPLAASSACSQLSCKSGRCVWRHNQVSPVVRLRRWRHGRQPAPCACLSSNSPAFGLSEEQVPGLHRLAAKLDIFPAMLALQADVLSDIHAAIDAQRVPTKLSADGRHAFNSSDSSSSVAMQVSRGQHVDWVVASCTALGAANVGTIRINAFPATSVRVPKLDIELFAFFGKVAMYINLLPRANLWLDEAYLQRYYKTPMGPKARTWHDLELACMGDTALQPFKSRSQDMRVLTGQTALFYMGDETAQTTSVFAQYAKEAAAMWLERLQQPDALVTGPAEARQLAAYDTVMYAFNRKDPDNVKVASVFSEDALEQMLQLGSMDARVLT